MKKYVSKILLLYLLMDQLLFRFLLFPLIREGMSGYGYQGIVILSELVLLGVMAMFAARLLVHEIHAFQSNLQRCLTIAVFTAAMILVTEILFGMVLKAAGAVSFNQVQADLMKQTEFFRYGFETLIYAPFLEELIFRETLPEALHTSLSKPLNLFLCCFLFGIIHMETALLAGNLSGFLYLPLYMLAGFLLFAGKEKSGSLITCMIAHALVNLCVLIF